MSKVEDGPQETGALASGVFIAVKRSESLLKKSGFLGTCSDNKLESLILAQIERWRRA